MRTVNSLSAEETMVRAQVSEACRILAALGQGDLIWGHVSARDPQNKGAWIKAAGWGLDEVDELRVHLVDWDGVVIKGDGEPHLETAIHTAILSARPEIEAVVHTHSQQIVAFAVTGQELRPVSHDACLFVPPDIARFSETSDLITTAALGEAVARTLGDREAILLVNHGVVVVGETISTAVLRAVLLERACQTQLIAQAGGGIREWSTLADARSKRSRHGSSRNLSKAYAYLRRSVASRDLR
jgi:L-ribulose-5-phosphate 4-epimerase